MMSIEIREIISKKDLKKFVKFPFSLYKGNQYWAPPFIKDEIKTLNKDINPAFEYCKAKYWLAYKDGKVAGRIAAIINNTLIEKWNVKKARFGWIDFIDDPEVSRELLKAVEEWARENGLESIEGPMGFTDSDEEGMLIEGFEEQGTYATTYNFAYYPEHLKKLGYQKEVDWLEFEIRVPDEIPAKIVRINDMILKRSKLHLLDAKKTKDYRPYIPGFWKIIDESFAGLFGVIPYTEKQTKFYTEQYFGFLVPDYTKFILNEEDEVIAAGIALPSLTEALRKAKGHLFPFGVFHMLKALKKPTKLDFYLIGVKKEYIGRGVISIMMNEINKNAIKNGIKLCETNVELEDNKAVQDMWKHYDHRQHKRRRCFTKSI
jgi:GNAT superfamily N-acetyltransferase